MSHRLIVVTAVVLAFFAATAAKAQTGPTEQVRSAEIAFAKSMADRDAAAFAALIGDEAVFFGNQSVMRGKDAVVAGWKRYFEGAAAPFSWKPTEVEVLASGTLGMSMIGAGLQRRKRRAPRLDVSVSVLPSNCGVLSPARRLM